MIENNYYIKVNIVRFLLIILAYQIPVHPNGLDFEQYYTSMHKEKKQLIVSADQQLCRLVTRYLQRTPDKEFMAMLTKLLQQDVTLYTLYQDGVSLMYKAAKQENLALVKILFDASSKFNCFNTVHFYIQPTNCAQAISHNAELLHFFITPSLSNSNSFFTQPRQERMNIIRSITEAIIRTWDNNSIVVLQNSFPIIDELNNFDECMYLEYRDMSKNIVKNFILQKNMLRCLKPLTMPRRDPAIPILPVQIIHTIIQCLLLLDFTSNTWYAKA